MNKKPISDHDLWRLVRPQFKHQREKDVTWRRSYAITRNGRLVISGFTNERQALDHLRMKVKANVHCIRGMITLLRELGLKVTKK